MTLNSPEIQLKIAEWQQELRHMTDDTEVILQAYAPLKFDLSLNKQPAQEIIDTVCQETGVSFEKVRNKTRIREVVVTRQLIAFFCRKNSGLSCKSIGEMLGGRDHTTVLHACNTIQDLLDISNPDICRLVARIYKRFEMAQV